MMRLKTSRPNSSVPSRWAPPGGCSRFEGWARGSKGEISGAATASTMNPTTNRTPTSPTGWRITCRTISASPLRGRRAAPGVIRAVAASVIADPWIEIGVDQIDEQVDHDEDDRDEKYPGLDDRVVPLIDPVEDQPADAGHAEDLLDHDRPAQQVADLDPLNRDDRDRRVLKRVANQHDPFPQALRPRRANV